MSKTDHPALMGGDPTFNQPYHLVKPLFPSLSDLNKGLKNLSKTRFLSNQGLYVKTLEKELAEFFGVEYCALFSNGTVAEMCLFRCLDISGRVLVPSFTFPSTIQALHWIGIDTSFIDIDEKTLLMDHLELNDVISNDIGAILPVNLFGSCCQHDEISKISNNYHIPLIYDSAQAFGTKYKGQNIGSLGDAEFFSFHATKVFHTGEGGAVVTNDKDLYLDVCKIRSFGFEEYLNFSELGMNGKMNEFSAIIGLNLLKDFYDHLSYRSEMYDYYINSILDVKGMSPLDTRVISNVDSNFSYFCVRVDPVDYGLNNRELYYALLNENIISRCYFFPPVHRSSYYFNNYDSSKFNLPFTDMASYTNLVLPFHSEISFDDIDKIIFAIKKCQLHSKEIRKLISSRVPISWNDLYQERFVDPYDTLLPMTD